MKNRSGFTLIELLLVIAILALVSTLAVNRFGNVKDSAARKVSIANQQAVGRAVESFLALDGTVNRLDSLLDAEVPTTGATGFDYTLSTAGAGLYAGPDDLGALSAADVARRNKGLSDGLASVLCGYRVSEKEARALEDFGLAFVMRHNTYAQGYPSRTYGNGEDGTVPQAVDGLDPALSACLARAVTNGMLFAAINGRSSLGRIIYQDCGQELLTTDWRGSYDEATVKAEIDATGGPLLALGLGASASIIGATGGLEACPYSEATPANRYRNYILLLRLHTVGGGAVSSTRVEFAGVLDPEGNTIRAARHLLN